MWHFDRRFLWHQSRKIRLALSRRFRRSMTIQWKSKACVRLVDSIRIHLILYKMASKLCNSSELFNFKMFKHCSCCFDHQSLMGGLTESRLSDQLVLLSAYQSSVSSTLGGEQSERYLIQTISTIF